MTDIILEFMQAAAQNKRLHSPGAVLHRKLIKFYNRQANFNMDTCMHKFNAEIKNSSHAQMISSILGLINEVFSNDANNGRCVITLLALIKICESYHNVFDHHDIVRISSYVTSKFAKCKDWQMHVNNIINDHNKEAEKKVFECVFGITASLAVLSAIVYIS